MERKELVSGLVFSTPCNRGGDGVSLLLMRSADGFKLRGIVNSRNDWGMIQTALERLGTWTGNQMIQLGVTQASLTSGAKIEETQMCHEEGNTGNSHLEGGWRDARQDKSTR